MQLFIVCFTYCNKNLLLINYSLKRLADHTNETLHKIKVKTLFSLSPASFGSNIIFIYIWVTSRQQLKVKILKLLKMGFHGSKSAPKYNSRVLEQNIQSFISYSQLKIRKFWFFSRNINFHDFLTQKRETFCITH